MEKLTRTKKYADLRKQIQQDSESEIISKELSEYANKLNKIDKNNFDKMEIKNDFDYPKSHNRKTLIDTSEHSVIKDDSSIIEAKDQISDNEKIIDKFISEVKEYNKDKGLLTDTDTQLNIINTIRKKPNKNIIRPFGDIDLDEGVDLSVNSMSKKDVELDNILAEDLENDEFDLTIGSLKKSNTISLEIGNILKELEDSDIIHTVSIDKNKISTELEESKDQSNDEDEIEVAEETEEINDISKDLVENDDEYGKFAESQELQEITDYVEDKNIDEDIELDSIEEYNNKDGVINFIIVVLIVLLLVVIGIFIYFLLMNKGVI